jgi:hypothetical protein
MLAHAPDPELDDGPRSSGTTERCCIATRAVQPVERLIRFVLNPDGEVVPDLKRKLPGRGVWVTGARAALAEAVRRKAFARGFKREVRVQPDLVERTERLLERAALEALAVAGKGGQVVTGFTRVEAALDQGGVKALLHAADAAPDGVRKINASSRRRFGPTGSGPAMIDAFTSAQLDLALGRPNVIHAALLAGPASITVMTRIARLQRFRTGFPGDAGGTPAH